MSTPVNLTSYAARFLIGRDVAGDWEVTVAAKATFTWDREGRLTAVAPVPVLTHDEHAGEPGLSGLTRAAELGPRKPKVDLLFAGAVVFPLPIDQIDVSVGVGARVQKTVRVFGERRWEPGRLGGAVPSRPTPVTRVPIAWERAFGGTDPQNPARADRRNPVGSGYAETSEVLLGRPAPSFEDPSAPIASSGSRSAPVGLGPVASHWSPRVELAGTYDDAWRKNRAPRAPVDFDPRFFNVAPADQQLDTFVPGEQVRLTYMTANGQDRFALPELSVPVTVASTEDFTEEVTSVDTVVIEPEACRVSVVARAAAALPGGPLSLRRVVVGETTRGLRSALMTGRGHRLLGLARRRA